MNIIKRTLLIMASAAAIAACKKDNIDGGATDGQNRTVSVSLARYASGNAANEEPGTLASDITAYLFSGGKYLRTISDFEKDGEGYRTSIPETEGTLFFLSNNNGAADLSFLQENKTTDKEFRSIIYSANEGNPMLLSASADISGTGENNVEMKRTYCRIDVEIRTEDVSVESVSLTGIADAGYIFGQPTVASPENVGTMTETETFSPALETSAEGVFYLTEQPSENIGIKVLTRINGALAMQNATFSSELKRNNIYKIVVSGKGATVNVSVEGVSDWENGDETVTSPDLDKVIRVDLSNSVFPEGVEVVQDIDYDIIEVPYYPVEMTVCLNAGTEIDITGEAEGINITRTGDGEYGNVFRISTSLFPPAKPEEYREFGIRYRILDDTYEDKLVIRRKINGNTFSGRFSFGYDNVCDFGTYVDNELGTIAIPEGKKLELNVDKNEEWLKAEKKEDGSYRIVAGWRPNDPEADGRYQSAEIVISNEDGSFAETYTIKRRNFGLPVTYINGVYWCKYNATGTSTDFEDQILVPEDPAAARGQTVLEYLSSCSDEEYLAIFGDGYQGNSGEGKKVVYKDGMFQFDGYVYSGNENITTLPPAALAPSGYELPSTEYYDRIFGRGIPVDEDKTTVGYGTFAQWNNNARIFLKSGIRSQLEIQPEIYFPDLYHFSMYNSDGESVTFYGPGDQWNTNGINHNSILFGSIDAGNNQWFINSLKITRVNNAGGNDTRVLRFVKTPVEFTY